MTTLLVGGDPNNLQDCILRIDGDLPLVWDWEHDGEHGQYRPLRVGDRVTLATLDDLDQWIVEDDLPVETDPIPFATATVADVVEGMPTPSHSVWLVTAKNVEAL